MKKTIAAVLLLLMTVTLTVGCGSKITEIEGNFTYRDAVSVMASDWNPHTLQKPDDAYPADFLRVGLYGFVYNDALHPVKDKKPYEGYAIIPEMAAAMPVDVTAEIRVSHPEFSIPADASEGYAYAIDLNREACWEDGTPINADTYCYSMRRLLDPELKNSRAVDYYAGDFCIAGAENYAKQGRSIYNGALGIPVAEYLAGGGREEDLYLDIDGFWGVRTEDGKTFASIADDTMLRDPTVPEGGKESYVSAKYLYENYLKDGAPFSDYQTDYIGTATVYPDDMDFSGVGILKTGDYQITLVLGKPLKGFYLLYNLSGNWIVKENLYEACLKQEGDTWISDYNTDVGTTSSYGPYRLTAYQQDKYMKFERNETWYGYTDDNHIYTDPSDGRTYRMYQTDVIECQVAAEAETRKMMFLKGELMGYGLQASDYEEYRSSEFAYASPSETVFFLILNGNVDAIAARENSANFDRTTEDIETLTLNSFRRAVAVTYDRDRFAAAVSPARSGGFGIIGTNYIYDPETGSRYRDTDQAKRALCRFYSVDPDAYASLDEAASSITGYDPVKAKELYRQAFDEALEAGFLTDADGDGRSDQTVRIEYAVSADSEFMTATVRYLNEKMAEVTVGTPFEGRVEFYKSEPYGSDWPNKIRLGQSDTVLGGWSGSALNPFSLTDLFVNPVNAYDARWFDASAVDMTLSLGGEDITMTLREWSDALNGDTVKGRCFGEGFADTGTRLEILAAIEVRILETYDYLPMLQDGSMALLSRQVSYVVNDYNPIMGRGGIPYLRYHYTDEEWAAYVAEQGGILQY